MALLESMTDDELVSFLAESRPNIKLAEAAPAGGDNKPELNESEEDDMALTPEALQEAISAHPEVLIEALKGTDFASVIDARVATALSEEKTTSDAERDAVIARQWELRDLRDAAAGLIRESKLPEKWQTALNARFTLREDRSPTPDLDVVDELDEAGTVTKPAIERLREAVTEAIDAEREKLREVAPTRVRGQGATALKEGEELQGGGETTPPGEQPYWKTMLQESGVDPDKAYAAA